MKSILVCIDASAYAESVCGLAVWVAQRTACAVALLHVIQRNDSIAARNDWSGSIGLGVKTELLEALTEIDEAHAKIAIQRGHLLLDAAEERCLAAGITDVKGVHRHGGILETITELESNADLIVIGKRGASSSFAANHIGSKVERVIRASTKPVLVAAASASQINRIVLAFDGSEYARRALNFVGKSLLFTGLEIHLVFVSQDDEMSARLLETAVATLKTHAIDATSVILHGDPAGAIAGYAADADCDLLVMGAYGHSHIRNLIVGSTTTSLVRIMNCPVLLVR